MLLDYYKLREQPFGVTPDSRYLFLSPTHREALASLLYAIEAGRGFVALVASPGMGKTTLLFQLLNQLRNKATTIFLFQTIATPADLLRALLSDLGVRETHETLIEMQQRLNQLLVEKSRTGKRVVLVIDEAQRLDDAVLEMVRMLSNFETSREKLIQIILSGQPQLALRIASPELVQLRQRVSMFANLPPFSVEEAALYIDHRLRIAGRGLEAPLFSSEALALIARYSEGIPRNINNLCFNALSLGCALKRNRIDVDIVRDVVSDLDLERWRKKRAPEERPEDGSSGAIPAFLSAASAPPLLAGGLTKRGAALAILLFLTGMLFAIHHWSAAKTDVQRNGALRQVLSAIGLDRASPAISSTDASAQAEVVAAQGAGAATSFRAIKGPSALAHASTIRVATGQTLLGICVESFGKCDPALLQQIHMLNPRLINLDHIEPGQRILIPFSEAIQSIAEQPVKASVTERARNE